MVTGRGAPRARRAVLVLAVLGPMLAASSALATITPLRRLEYRVAWNGIPAGSAAVSIAPGEADGRETLSVQGTAGTNAFVSLFWSFRGTMQVTMLADGPAPHRFDYRRDINGSPYATTIDFAEGTAHGVYEHRGVRQETEMTAEVVDPVTAVFRAIGSDAGPGDDLWYDVWTGEIRYLVKLDIRKRETIDVPAGRFAALQVVPHVWRIEGRPAPDTRIRRATIWVTDDARHVPLRVQSKVFLGSVSLDLLELAPRE